MPSPRHDHVIRHTKADGVAQEITHRPPWRVDRRLAQPIGVKALRIEPCAVDTRDRAIEIGDAGDHRGPDLGRRVLVRPVVIATRLVPETASVVQLRDSATAQV